MGARACAEREAPRRGRAARRHARSALCRDCEIMRSAATTLLLLASVATCAASGVVLARAPARRRQPPMAVVLDPNSLAEVVVVEGGLNFLNLYQGVITIRILLSWFPQAQSVGILQPLFQASDVYLNLFRGVVPPIGGIDISPIGAFFVLNLLQNGVASLACTADAPVKVQPRLALPGSRLVQQALRRKERAAIAA